MELCWWMRIRESHSPKYSTRKPKRSWIQTAFGTARRNPESQSALEHLTAPGSGPAGTREGRSEKWAEDSGDNWRSVPGTVLVGTPICFPHPHREYRQPGIKPPSKNQIAGGTNDLEEAKPSTGSTVHPEWSTALAGGSPTWAQAHGEQASQPRTLHYTEGSASHPLRW